MPVTSLHVQGAVLQAREKVADLRQLVGSLGPAMEAHTIPIQLASELSRVVIDVVRAERTDSDA